MRFGKTLQASIHPPWRDHYIDYAKIKKLLREGDDSDSERTPASRADELEEWTENDESEFVHELVNVQLEKVNNFQREMNEQLKSRTANCEARLEQLVSATPVRGPTSSLNPAREQIGGEERQKTLTQVLEDLDGITSDINELEKFSRVNFTGFLKAAKKHDRRSRGVSAAKGKGKGKGRGATSGEYKVRPLLQVRLSALEFNREDYSPLLYRLSAMYAFVRENIDRDANDHGQTRTSSVGSGPQPHGSRKYISHKFWVHPDNILEVKTFILRRLPVLIYNPQPSKEVDASRRDPTINSLYFDNPQFSLYHDKLSKASEAASLRLRWYGRLSDKPDILLERKTMRDSETEGAVEERITLKEKYVMDFINGNYAMEKTVQKMKDRPIKNGEDVNKYEALVRSLQDFIKEKKLEPMLRAIYTRTAFQIPGDDRVRVSLDTDLALIRDDCLDEDRPCRDPEEWHRKDIDDAEMEYPFSALRKGEISRFPYALLEIKVLESGLHGRSKEWVNDLMNSHLVKEAPRFSKFVHGISVLFDDHVSSFPFWLSELDTKDIRQDPKQAWEVEQQKVKKQIEDETIVGSFRPGSRDFGGRSAPFSNTPNMYGATPPVPERGFPKIAPQGEGAKKSSGSDEQSSDNNGDSEEDDSDTEDLAKVSHSVATASGLRNLFPTFSTSRYGRAHRKPNAPVILPPGVQKPGILIMHSGPVQVEAKVWLANQRTFLKWQHVSVLLASLSLGLYNAAGKHNHIAQWLAVVYTAIAVFAAGWGYTMYMWRSRLIRERSGKDFDNVLGPVVVCLALAVALAVNFAFQYRNMKERKGHAHPPITTTAPEIFNVSIDKEHIVGLIQQGGY
ncbi:SPX-domain-containing protein [Choiromyces venosus 120613-1]|uniref:SPX-domain-containing protein n=1 Tax=Choiromyces venosus 120613-1 TaxID=1336337 RepID=A0A3N4K004_9PEZI|nr:SPX-domain-containing protein [Choiromyces venosus 120613-1]